MSEALSIAQGYFKRGWQPLPLNLRSKNPGETLGKGWQNFRITEAELSKYFNGAARNIGVLLGKPSNNLVDIDLDTPEAVKLAPFFLPETKAIFGRAGNPRSHWLYVADFTKTEQLEDPLLVNSKDKKERDEATIVEIRSTGVQTVFPGSTHEETGEKIEWFEQGEPAQVDAKVLRRAVTRLAAAALLARYWRNVFDTNSRFH